MGKGQANSFLDFTNYNMLPLKVKILSNYYWPEKMLSYNGKWNSRGDCIAYDPNCYKRNVYIHTLMYRKAARKLYAKMFTTEWYDFKRVLIYFYFLFSTIMSMFWKCITICIGKNTKREMVISGLWYYGNFSFLLHPFMIFLVFYSDYVTPLEKKISEKNYL